MDKQMQNILFIMKKNRNLDCINKKIYISFYNFFIENYKKYGDINDLIRVYLIFNGKDKLNETINFFNKLLNVNLKIDKRFIKDEIKRYSYVKNFEFYREYKNNNIIKFNDYKNYISKNKNINFKTGYFSIYAKWFDNYVILKDLYNNKRFKVYIPENIINNINISDILNIKILKKEKNFWSIYNIYEFYPNGLNNNIYREYLI